MKRILLYISVVLISLTACQKKNYDLEITGSVPILIVDARVHSHTTSALVNLSSSTDFLGDNPQDIIEDALVFINTNGTGETQLTYLKNGNYELANIAVAPGSTYELRIEWQSQSYSASTELLDVVPISFFVFEENPSFGGKDEEPSFNFNMILNLDFDKTDYFLTEATTYDSITGDFVKKDYLQWADESYTTNPALFPFFVQEYPLGDSIRVEFNHVTFETFEFYNSLSEVADQTPGSIAPANPLSNISNGAIGNFGAFATDANYFVITP